jgi:hypothetical protein
MYLQIRSVEVGSDLIFFFNTEEFQPELDGKNVRL